VRAEIMPSLGVERLYEIPFDDDLREMNDTEFVEHVLHQGLGIKHGLHKLYGKYGSTEIRKALQQGDVFHAAHMLSRPWIVDGVVQKGQQLGRTLGFPTANLPLGDLVVPHLLRGDTLAG